MLDSRLRSAQVARLATVRPDGRPHLVPIVFACADDTVYTPIDGKPKQGKPLRRLENIAHEPRVSLLVDGYAEDWSQLWWLRADGTAEVTEDEATVLRAHELLRAKYRQYERVALHGTVIAITVHRCASWSAS